MVERKLLEVAKELTGRERGEEALAEIVKTYVKHKLEEWQEKVKRFEEKYGMPFEEFEERLGRELDLSWEHERDYMDWDWALTELRRLERWRKELSELC